MAIRPVVLLVPSLAAALELPRRLAGRVGAVTGLLPFKLLDLARAIVEPTLLGEGREAWHFGHDALLAARLIPEARSLAMSPLLPLRPAALALARTLGELRRGGVSPGEVEALARGAGQEDAPRLRDLAVLLRRFDEVLDTRFADPAVVLRAAAERVAETSWLQGAQVLLVDDLEPNGVERRFLLALARRLQVRLLDRERPPALRRGSFASWAARHGIASLAWSESPLAPVAPPSPPEGLARIRGTLFEPPEGGPVADHSVELVTAPGEAAEVRALVRRLLREASRGVPFEEMGVVLPRPEEYAALFTDVLERLQVPFRLHPSLPLRFGRTARSLMLLFACRGLERSAVMEFLSFARVRYAALLGEGVEARVAQWEALSRQARIVSGLERWIVGLRAHAELEREQAGHERDAERRDARTRRAQECDRLLAVVEGLSQALDRLSGHATWSEWSAIVGDVLDQWLLAEEDDSLAGERELVARLIAEMGALVALDRPGAMVAWSEFESALVARFEQERMPLRQRPGGALHVGALDAMAGLPFRVLAIAGLVEGGYPGVIRPDPFLLDEERAALRAAVSSPRRPTRGGQLRLFDDAPTPADSDAIDGDADAAAERPLPTSQDRLLEARRLFHRAASQATEKLILSYPRADGRTGRERLPSLFLVAAAAAREGRNLGLAELSPLVHEDDPATLPLEEALDAPERDRIRILRGGEEAAQAIAGGSVFFKQSRLAHKARWGDRLSAYDGFLAPLPAELFQKLDPVSAAQPISASRLALYATCGFKYMLENVVRLEPVLEPEERRRLEPIERGSLFHDVAERFLRERRDKDELPVRDTLAMRERLREMGDQALDGLVAGSPPRFTLLWERERTRFHATLLSWLQREAAVEGAIPAHFEVPFGLNWPPPPGEPFDKQPLVVDLGDGRALRVSGKIDRIDRRPDGTLSLRDYKTGRAPRDDGGTFRGGRQLQIPFYILAIAKLLPGSRVSEAFLDYVDGGRQVSFDPEAVTGDALRSVLRSMADAIAQGVFAQDPGHCDFCDYTAVCGPKGLVERRRAYKLRDSRLQRVMRLKDVL